MRWGKTVNDDPYRAPMPELVDISISNHCTKGCTFCYRDSVPNHVFMSLEDYERVIQSLNHERWGNVFQVALGSHGRKIFFIILNNVFFNLNI